MFREYLSMIIQGKQLDEEQMTQMITEVLSGDITDAQIGAMMAALATRGETYRNSPGPPRPCAAGPIEFNRRARLWWIPAAPAVTAPKPSISPQPPLLWWPDVA